MLSLSGKIAFGVAGAALLAAPIAALAAHGKAGLWQISVTMSGSNVHMPDMSNVPPEVQARMKAMGVGMAGNTITIQRCMSATDFAMGRLPSGGSAMGGHDKNCATSNVSFTGTHMTADMTCTGSFEGTGHVQADWDSEDHYTEEATVTGTHNGQAVTNTEKMEGRFLSAQCGSAGQ